MKIFVVSPNENWILDRIATEWKRSNPNITTNNIYEADIIWLLSSWQWKMIPVELLNKKKIIATIHHITPWKFTKDNFKDFLDRDRIIDCYHVPCEKTKESVEKLTKKEIFVNPFWVNQNLWHCIDKNQARKDLGLKEDEFIVGSFQRDTEGHDLKTPKLEKGPDIFCNIVENLATKKENLSILLSGFRRQYVIERLKRANIKYYYYEKTDFKTLNKLYNSLDLYIVSSRCEGGPQAIVESAITKTPIISTDVGLAGTILSKKSIFSPPSPLGTPDVDYAYNCVSELVMPKGFNPFIDFFTNKLGGEK